MITFADDPRDEPDDEPETDETHDERMEDADRFFEEARDARSEG